MIIGISGKIGSGKDTVAKIIQVLTHIENTKSSFGKAFLEAELQECIKGSFNNVIATKNSNWQVKKFAGKLKEIISLLTGVSLADLEKEEVKNSLLPDSWQYWYITNWGKNAGLLRNLQFATEKGAKDFCNNSSNSQHKYEYKKTERTYRWLLQHVGTELFRDGIHQNVHINALFSDYKTLTEEDKINYFLQLGINDYNVFKKTNYEKYLKAKEEFFRVNVYKESFWLVTDLRFPNELEAVEERNGITIRVNRSIFSLAINLPEYLSYIKCTKEEAVSYKGIQENNRTYNSFVGKDGNYYKIIYKQDKVEHPSETALDNAKFDYTIENNGTIEELVEKVRVILVAEKLL